MDTKHITKSKPETPAKQPRLRIATVWFGGCSGCHMSFLDLDEFLLELAGKAEIVFSPIMDIKEYPENVDVCLMEGAICNQDNLEMAHKVRARTKVLVSFGDCAVTGNVPSMRNGIPVRKLLERIYVEGADLSAGIPTEGVPPLNRQAEPLRQVVKVDLNVPGCPPRPNAILMVLSELLEGREPDLGSKLRFG